MSKQLKATKIKVVGTGGSGCNAITRMKKCKIRGVELIAINSDAQDLKKTKADKKIRIGRELTRGLGTGMNPKIGEKAALEQKEEIKKALKDTDMVFITLGTGGGCLRGSSRIFTNPGKAVRIDSIKPGATVYTFLDNKVAKRKVLGAKKTGVKKVLELKTNNRTIYASEDHPFLKVKPLERQSKNRFSEFDLEWTELQDLKEKDLVVLLRKVPDEGKPLELPDGSLTNKKFCQLFGFLVGDGWISKSKKSWEIYFSPSDNEEQNQKYIDLIKEVFGLEMKQSSHPSASWYYAGSKKVYDLLDKLGLNKPSPEKEIPDWVFTLPESQKKSFIIGLADADANYSTQEGDLTGLPKKEIKFEMSSEVLIKQLKALCDSIGLRTSNVTSRTRVIKAPHSKEAKPMTSWLLRIYRTHELLEKLPHPNARTSVSFAHNYRKRPLPEFFKNFGFSPIRSIKEIGEEEVYDITVDGSHNFIANGLVVHNTGSGAAPIIAEIAKEQGALTVAVVTKPFSFEGAQRKMTATKALKKLKDKVDTLVVIPNDKITEISEEDVSLEKAFWRADEVLRQAVSGISELIVGSGIVNVDFADIKTIMKDSGRALFGIGRGKGKERAKEAVENAINSPFLTFSIKGAKGVLFNVSGRNVTLSEINRIASLLSNNLSSKARLIFGAFEDKNLKKDEIKVTVIATGFK